MINILHKLYSSFTESLLKSTKRNILKGRSFKFKHFWNEDLSIQRKKRDAATTEAERTKRKSPEEQRQAVIEWRRECALMKRKVMEAKRQSWNMLLNRMDYRTDSEKAHILLNALKSRKQLSLTTCWKLEMRCWLIVEV